MRCFLAGGSGVPALPGPASSPAPPVAPRLVPRPAAAPPRPRPRPRPPPPAGYKQRCKRGWSVMSSSLGNDTLQPGKGGLESLPSSNSHLGCQWLRPPGCIWYSAAIKHIHTHRTCISMHQQARMVPRPMVSHNRVPHVLLHGHRAACAHLLGMLLPVGGSSVPLYHHLPPLVALP